MAIWVAYRGLQVPDVSTGDAGVNLTANFKAIADCLDIPGALSVTHGGTGTSTAFTAGALVFAGTSGVYAQDATKLFWDNTNKRLGIGTATPAYPFELRPAASSLVFSSYIVSQNNNATGVTCTGLRLTHEAQGATASSATQIGIWASAQTAPSSTANYSASVRGMTLEASHYGTGTLASLMGIRLGAYHISGAGAITNRIGVVSSLVSDSGTSTTNTYGFQLAFGESGSVTNHYSFYSPASTATNDWGVYSSNAKNYFGGKLSVIDTSYGAQLTVTSAASGTICMITKGAASQSANLQEWQNSSGTVLASVSSGGNLLVKHLIGGTSAPSIAAGTGAGTSPTLSVTGTDAAGEVSVTAGTSPAGGAIVATITFNAAYASAPYVVFSPSSDTAAGLSATTAVYMTTTTTTFVLRVRSGGLVASTNYKWHYQVVQ